MRFAVFSFFFASPISFSLLFQTALRRAAARLEGEESARSQDMEERGRFENVSVFPSFSSRQQAVQVRTAPSFDRKREKERSVETFGKLQTVLCGFPPERQTRLFFYGRGCNMTQQE